MACLMTSLIRYALLIQKTHRARLARRKLAEAVRLAKQPASAVASATAAEAAAAALAGGGAAAAAAAAAAASAAGAGWGSALADGGGPGTLGLPPPGGGRLSVAQIAWVRTPPGPPGVSPKKESELTQTLTFTLHEVLRAGDRVEPGSACKCSPRRHKVGMQVLTTAPPPLPHRCSARAR